MASIEDEKAIVEQGGITVGEFLPLEAYFDVIINEFMPTEWTLLQHSVLENVVSHSKILNTNATSVSDNFEILSDSVVTSTIEAISENTFDVTHELSLESIITLSGNDTFSTIGSSRVEAYNAVSYAAKFEILTTSTTQTASAAAIESLIEFSTEFSSVLSLEVYSQHSFDIQTSGVFDPILELSEYSSFEVGHSTNVDLNIAVQHNSHFETSSSMISGVLLEARFEDTFKVTSRFEVGLNSEINHSATFETVGISEALTTVAVTYESIFNIVSNTKVETTIVAEASHEFNITTLSRVRNHAYNDSGIADLPVWAFEPNWNSDVRETLEWLTDVLISPSGAEQRRSLRNLPRRTFEYTLVAKASERSYLDHMLTQHGSRDMYLPVWHETHYSADDCPAGSNVIPCETAASSEIFEGDIIMLSDGTPRNYELASVMSITTQAVLVERPLLKAWPSGTFIRPVRLSRLVEQPSLKRLTDDLVTANVKFITRVNNDDIPISAAEYQSGPLILNGLVANNYDRNSAQTGHSNGGNAESQAIFIRAALLAYEQLAGGNTEERVASDYYLKLAQELLDSLGGDSFVGPVIRQPISPHASVLTVPNMHFVARGDIIEQKLVYDLTLPFEDGSLTIPHNWHGSNVQKVWSIYPEDSNLLFKNPNSPAFNPSSPEVETQVNIEHWYRDGVTTVIEVPMGTPSLAEWRVVYSHNTNSPIALREAYEPEPFLKKIPSGHVQVSGGTFRAYELAFALAIQFDGRQGKLSNWMDLRASMRQSGVRSCVVTDRREILQPLPEYVAIPPVGPLSGSYTYSNHPDAIPPMAPGLDNNWSGYDFWRRDSNGDIVADVPFADVVSEVRFGRLFGDQWREQTSYQEADQFLYITMSTTKKPVLNNGERVLIFLSSSASTLSTERWYADIGSLSNYVAKSDDVIEFFIPRSAFRIRVIDEHGETSWGSQLPAGTHLENFGVQVEMAGEYQIRIRDMRLVSGQSESWVLSNKALAVKGAVLPYTPAITPFVVNADVRRQTFLGENGSPFHGNQLPDYWWWANVEVGITHDGLEASDLPVINRMNGAIEYPINPNTPENLNKPVNALLMEQQLIFLQHAQLQWVDDGGTLGPFAHTFVQNVRSRVDIGNPQPHGWVYTSAYDDSDLGGYQSRVVESMASLVDLSHNDARYMDATNRALNLTQNWLTWVNTAWPNLNGKQVGEKIIYGIPNIFPNPSEGNPYADTENPHCAALIMRTCLWLEKSGKGDSVLNRSLITRCWQYLELMWQTEGEMASTWSKGQEGFNWPSHWHGEIITSLSLLLKYESFVPPIVDLEVVRRRLVQTSDWLVRAGVRYSDMPTGVLLPDNYRGMSVLSSPPDEVTSLDYDYERMVEELDNQTGLPHYFDSAKIPFMKQRYIWVLRGRTQHKQFRELTYNLRGRVSVFWVPTFFQDFRLVADTPVNDSFIIVENTGYFNTGGIRTDRRDIMIELTNGEKMFRRIIAVTTSGSDREVLGLDTPLYEGLKVGDVHRISFITMCRLDQDNIEILHKTDSAGVATTSLSIRTAPELRRMEAGF